MKRFLKENLTLIVGLTLPALLIIVFAAEATLTKKFVRLPKYDLLYMTMPYPHDGVSTEIVEGKLQISITPEVRKGMLPMPRLFRFDAKTQSSKEIPLTLQTVPPLSQNAPGLKKEELEISNIKNLQLDPNDISPDGYKAEFSSPNDGSTINFLILNSYKRSFVIRKSGNTITIIDETNNGYGDKSIKFLGWIISE